MMNGSNSAIGIAADSELTVVRTLLLSNPALLHELGQIVDPAIFADRLCDAASQHGISIAAADLLPALRPDPLGIGRWAPAPVNPAGWPGEGWLPSRSVQTNEGLAFDWAWFGGRGLDQPFYEDSVRQLGHLPLSQFLRARTGLANLVAGWREQSDPVTPAGLVFHMSRCGSTLVARMLQSLPGCYAASEPEPFDAVVQWAWRAQVSEAEKIAALRAVAAALGRNRPEPGSRFFIKLDCWHIFSLPLLRAAFPETPWLFLTRDPLEVAVSQMAMPGVHIVPGMIGADMVGIEGGEAMPQEEYCARVLGRMCDTATDYAAVGGGLVIDYRDLPKALCHEIPHHFGIGVNEPTEPVIASLLSVDAKHPGQAFSADTVKKRGNASSHLVEAIERHAMPAYRRLALSCH
jgi:Sulfotransferase family